MGDQRELWRRVWALAEAVGRLDEQNIASRRALDVAVYALEHRLAGLNDLRNDVLSKSEYEPRHEQLENELKLIEARLEQRASVEIVAENIRRLDTAFARIEVLEKQQVSAVSRGDAERQRAGDSRTTVSLVLSIAIGVGYIMQSIVIPLVQHH